MNKDSQSGMSSDKREKGKDKKRKKKRAQPENYNASCFIFILISNFVVRHFIIINLFYPSTNCTENVFFFLLLLQTVGSSILNDKLLLP